MTAGRSWTAGCSRKEHITQHPEQHALQNAEQHAEKYTAQHAIQNATQHAAQNAQHAARPPDDSCNRLPPEDRKVLARSLQLQGYFLKDNEIGAKRKNLGVSVSKCKLCSAQQYEL